MQVIAVRDGRGRSYAGKSERDRLAEGERMLVDRGYGMRVSEMCEKYHVSRATLYRRLDDALAARIATTVDKYREQQSAVLDEQMQRWEQQVNAAEELIRQAIEKENLAGIERGMALHATALNGQLRVLERRAKLLGLDAPVRVEATVTASEGVGARVAAMRQRLEATG